MIMWRQIVLVFSLVISTLAIRVPVDSNEENVKDTKPVKEKANKKQDVFYISDPAEVDSYLIPPDPHRLEDVLFDDIVTPATYLLPPSPEKHFNYYLPTEPGQQTDWYPIAQYPIQSTPVESRRPDLAIPIVVADNQTSEFYKNPRGGKSYGGDRFNIPLPSRQLEPPTENASGDYILSSPSGELELPIEEVNQHFKETPSPLPEYQHPAKTPNRKNFKKNVVRIKAQQEPIIALHLTPPRRPQTPKYRNPTKLYPKKFNKGFHPVPIPIGQFGSDDGAIPQAKPIMPYKPVISDETEYFAPVDEKKLFLYEQAEQKRKLKGGYESQQQQPTAADDTRADNAPVEPLTSETNFKHPTRNIHPSNLVQAPAPASSAPQPKKVTVPRPPPDGERTEFRMHGMKGPQSYQFGYDTGKGKNRQFRYEERDNDGRVKGHYGYMDKDGKMRVVNYDADPEKGFHAEAPQEADPSDT